MNNNDLVKLYAAYKSGCIGDNILNTYFTFFANIMLENHINVVEEAQIASLFEKRYQISLPLDFVRQVLGVGMENSSIIDDHGKYIVKPDILKQYKFNGTDFDSMWKELIFSLKDYCEKKNIALNHSSIEKDILDCIDNTDEAILSNEKLNSSDGVNQFDFAWYSFVREICNTNAEIFDFITSLCASNITKQAIFFPCEKGSDYSSLNCYLDSPMIFALLGMDNPERTDSYKLLVKNMQKAGCSVQILDHNFHEVEGIVSRAAAWAVSNQYDLRKANNAARYFHDPQMSKEEIAEFCESIEYKLNELEITIKETNYDVYQNQFQEDEQTLYNMVSQKYTDLDLVILPEKEESIKIDVRSIVMIYRERQGRTSMHITQAGHIMLTTNNAIANVCKKFESNRSINSGHIPACVSADLFGAILWLSSPTDMMNYQRKKLLADCYDFLQPSKELVDRYIKSLESAKSMGEIDERKYLFMRTHRVVLDALMNVTRGDYARFNDRTYLEVYDVIVAQSEKKYEDESTAHLQTKEKLDIIQKEKVDLEKRVARMEQESEQNTNVLTQKINSLETLIRNNEIQKFNNKCSFWGWTLTIILFGIPYILLIAIADMLKGYFSDFSMYSICSVCVLVIIAIVALLIFNRGKRWCFDIIRKKFEKKDTINEQVQ